MMNGRSRDTGTAARTVRPLQASKEVPPDFFAASNRQSVADTNRNVPPDLGRLEQGSLDRVILVAHSRSPKPLAFWGIPVRLQVLTVLKDECQGVTAIVAALGWAQPLVSHPLRLLEAAARGWGWGPGERTRIVTVKDAG